MRYFIRTYGCQMNDLDSEVMSGQLAQMGMDLAHSEDDADVIVFNTCSVRETAERKVFGRLGSLAKLKRNRPDMVIAVCGCMAEEHKEQFFKRYPHVDVVCGTNSFDALPEMIAEAMDRRSKVARTGVDGEMELPFADARRSSGIKAFVSIMRGCDKYCSYCIVPFVRGPESSRPSNKIRDEIVQLAQKGFREVTLLGQNVNSYGRGIDENTDFPTLLEKVHDVEGIERIRFVTSHPKDMSPRLIQTIADLPKVCEYLHFPMQAGSDTVLERMNRGYTRSEYLGIVERLREKVKDIALSSEFIVGFPGETDEDFELTLSAAEDIRYDSAFMFKYSPREGTAAAKFEDDVPKEVKEERHRRLRDAQNRISTEIYTGLIGGEVEVLVEGPSRKDPSRLVGRTRDNKIAVFKGSHDFIGEIVSLRVEEANIHTLYCTLT